jgi:Zn-dependent peptidase ImmA (M78 family)
MPPARVDVIAQGDQRPKVEKLADNFSSGLLIPFEHLKGCWRARQPNQDIHGWIIAAAKDFRVSGDALYWRLVNTGLLPKLAPIDHKLLSRSDEDDRNGKPNHYSAEFVRRLHSVLHHGLVSVRKAAALLDCEPNDLREIVSAYGFDPSF